MTSKRPNLRRLTIADYYRMAEVGIIKPSERVGLLNGRIIQRETGNPTHETIVDMLSEVFVSEAHGRYRVRVRGPIQISPFSELHPDLVLYRRDVENRHPNHQTFIW
jgi:hypothetical protein